jgi:hypothetical protein
VGQFLPEVHGVMSQKTRHHHVCKIHCCGEEGVGWFFLVVGKVFIDVAAFVYTSYVRIE